MEDALLQYGAIGVIAIVSMAAVRVLYAKLNGAYERERDRADRLEQELRQLNEAIRNDYVHTIGDATRAVADALAAVRRSREN